jgi:hypothetical protein
MTTVTISFPTPNPVPEVTIMLTQKDLDPITHLPVGDWHQVPYATWPTSFPVSVSGFSGGFGMLRIVRDSDSQSLGFGGLLFSDVSRNVKTNLGGPGDFSVHAELTTNTGVTVKSTSITVTAL